MKGVKVIRCADERKFEEAVNKVLNMPIWINDIKYTTEAVYDKYNGQGVPINVSFFDTAYIYYEDDPKCLMDC